MPANRGISLRRQLTGYSHDKADVAIIRFIKEEDLDIRSVHYPSHFVGANFTFTTIHPESAKKGGVPVYSHAHSIQTGDDVAALGLFIEDYGEEANFPVARFGHIARMPSLVNTPRWKGDEFRSNAYLAEFFAFPGLSGSPVFWFAQASVNKKVAGGYTATTTHLIPALVGSVNGYVGRPQKADVIGDVLGTITTEINTGIATVTPSAAIEEMLKYRDLCEERDEILSRVARDPTYVIPASAIAKIEAIHEPYYIQNALPQHELQRSLTTEIGSP